MKKALIAIISVIFVVAIVIVSFLGIRAEVHDITIYVQEIVLNNKDEYKPRLPETETNRISRVLKRPAEEEIDPETGVGITDEVNWNFAGRKRDYAVYIDNYYYLFSKKGGKYTIDTTVNPVDATHKELQFYLSYYQEYNADIKNNISLTSSGELTIQTTHDGWIGFDVIISSTDLSGVEIDILFKISSYE